LNREDAGSVVKSVDLLEEVLQTRTNIGVKIQRIPMRYSEKIPMVKIRENQNLQIGKNSKVKNDFRTIDMEKILVEAHSLWDEGREVEAFDLFKKAAKNSIIGAYNNIGLMLDKGAGVTKDKKLALKWYKRAARSGDTVSYHNIGLFYFYSGNISCAKKWFLRAIESGDHGSALYLSKIYLANSKSLKVAKKYAIFVKNSDLVSESDTEQAEKLLSKIERLIE
jgi:TPR repeat protein